MPLWRLRQPCIEAPPRSREVEISERLQPHRLAPGLRCSCRSQDVRPVSPVLTIKPLSNPLRGARKEPRPGPEGQDALKMYRLAADQGVDLGVFRKPAELFLGESEPPIDGDLENTGNTLDELDFLRTSFHKPRPRTEGPWFIVSGHAVFDFDLHCCHL